MIKDQIWTKCGFNHIITLRMCEIRIYKVLNVVTVAKLSVDHTSIHVI